MDHSPSIRDSILTWLESMRVSPARYRMNAGADDTIFTSCFALYILDLFGETERFTAEEREQWVSRIQSGQDPRDGYFKLNEDLHTDRERSRPSCCRIDYRSDCRINCQFLAAVLASTRSLTVSRSSVTSDDFVT
jgi:hypothetical protein